MAEYSEQLNLEFDPFDPDNRIDHFFPGGNRQELLDQLLELCSYSSDLVAVTGPLGSGKTTLSHWLALSLDEEFVAVQVQATLFMTAEQLLEAICQELDMEVAGDSPVEELVARLDRYADTLQARSRTLQIIIDDAHELGAEALQCVVDLLELQADASNLGDDGIKALLLGEATLLDSVEQLAPSAHQALELTALNAEQTADYLEFKLGCAGFEGRLPIDRDGLAVIHSRSRGIPGTIDVLARDELGDSFSARQTLPELSFPERHLVAASVVFGAVVLVLFLTLGGENPPGPGDTVAISGTIQSGQAVGAGQVRVQVPLTLDGAGTASVAGPDTVSSVRSVSDAERSPAASVTNTGSAAVASESERAGTRGPDSRESELADVGTTVASVSSATGSKPLATERDVGAVNAADSPPTPQSHAPAAARGLLARAPESYTLQLLGSHSEANVKDFINRQGDPDRLSYFESRYQDKPWFVVVYGDFPNRSAAQDAIAQLPTALQELQPWARNLAEIQADIRRYQ